MAVQVFEVAEGVRGDELPGRFLAQEIHLQLLIGHRRFRGESVVVQQVAWIGARRGQVRQPDLLPAAITLAPEDSTPGFVQRFQAAVLAFEPVPERGRALIAVTAHGIVTAKLVVDLPADDRGVPPITLGHGTHDAFAVPAIGGAGGTIVAPRAAVPGAALGIHGEHFGIIVRQPGRRCGRRGAKHHLQPRGCQGRNGLIQPTPSELPLRWLHQRPREFRDAHIGQASVSHHLCVDGPALGRPMFGIVADT